MAIVDTLREITQRVENELKATDTSAALDALGEITGETMSEQVISEVFARFCVGK